jgi:hypothetical protein
MYYLWQRPPSWLAAVTWLGFLPGAFVAWLLTGWASRRLEPSAGMSGPAATGAVLGVLCVVPAALLALASGGPADETAAPSWQGLGHALRTPAVLFGIVAALLLLIAAAQRPPRRLPQWRRQARRMLGGLRRRPLAAVALTVAGSLLLGLGGFVLVTRQVQPGSCTPTAPTGIVDPPEARMSYRARVFLSRQATDDERNLAEAAIWRGMGGSSTYAGDPRSGDFLAAYCPQGRVRAGAAEALPRHWTVQLASPGLFGGLAAEMIVMPGIVAVHHLPD